MSELKPCPFCGGEAEIIGVFGSNFHRAVCDACFFKLPPEINEEEAISAWNRRAKRTCHNVMGSPKTCAFWPIPRFKCSLCGVEYTLTEYPNYCPNCGAKVVE